MECNNRKKQYFKIFFTILFSVFFVASVLFIEPGPESQDSMAYSFQLNKVTEKTDNGERIVYKDRNGNIAFATDAGYAIKTTVYTEEGKRESFYDEKNNPVVRSGKYCSVMHEYDRQGREIRTVFYGTDGEPVINADGYAIKTYTYNESGECETERYYDTTGTPICTHYYGYGKKYEYSEDGMTRKESYTDAQGNPVMTRLGYATRALTFYTTTEKDTARVQEEMYYDEQGKPAPLYMGQYGARKEYNEIGQQIKTTFLGADGMPIVTKKGYATIVYSYGKDGQIEKEQYYDVSGNPFRMPEGQYGRIFRNGQEIYLNADGSEQFNLKRFLYNQSGCVILIVLVFVAFSVMTNKRINIVLLVLCIISIVYLTLLFRNVGGKKSNLILFRLFKQIFSNSGVRSDVIRNIWLFIPIGAVLFRLYPRIRIVLFPVIISIIIETIQYYSGTGFCEPDDVISNSIGALTGYCLGNMLTEIKTRAGNKTAIPGK